MIKLYSERAKSSQAAPDVYNYDFFPKEFRNQCHFILSDIANAIESLPKYRCYWTLVYNVFIREKGFKYLTNPLHIEAEQCESYMSSSDEFDFLDFLDLAFQITQHIYNENASEFSMVLSTIPNSLEELNYRFRQHNLGYELVNGEIIRMDNKVLHQEVVKPALQLLTDEIFSGAEQEFRKAYEYYRKNDNKNAILEAGKAFESTMKTICDELSYPYNPAKDTASKLISILDKNNFFPSYLSNHLSGIKTTLETGLPVVRNKNAGHGQGSVVQTVPIEYTEYALNLAATNIVFLVKLYQSQK